jgi:predicted CopG family antitoxin
MKTLDKDGHPIKISDDNRKKLLQLKLDWNMKSVDAVIARLLEINNEQTRSKRQ